MEPESFPPNSKAKKEEPKLEKIVTGSVARRKKPATKKFFSALIADDAPNVGQYIILEVIIPAIKDVIADVVSQGIEKVLFGSARSTSRRTGARPGLTGGPVNYNKYSSTPPWSRSRDDRPQLSQRARGSHDFDDIILATRSEAEEVLNTLFELISKYNQATVSDLYELVGISGNFTDEKWGWTDFRGAGIQRINSGYLLDLPKPEPLD